MKSFKILIVFLGNPAHDSRSFKIFKSLSNLGCTVKIICAHQPGENFLNDPNITYVEIKSYKRAFFKILMFYIKALSLVLRKKADIVIASDLFALPLAWLASRKNDAKLVYDSREFYSSLASLHRREFKQWLIIKYEQFFASNCSLILTVNKSLNKLLSNKFYNKKIYVLHNFPTTKKDATKSFIIPENLFNLDDLLLVYFGLFHPGRGLNLYLELLEKLRPEFPHLKLLLIGKGELKPEIENEIKKRKLQNSVFIFGPYSPEQYILMPTVKKIIGLSIIEPIGLSYFYSLPNKIFDYIQHQIPFIASNFPEIRDIVERYKVGILVNPANFDDLLSAVRILLIDDNMYENLKQNCNKALSELSWEKEIEKFYEVIKSL